MSFNADRVTREQMVAWSVFDYIKAALHARGFPDDQIEYLQSFQSNLFGREEGIDKVYVAAGFHADDGGKSIEMGSNLRRKCYSMEYWILGPTTVQAQSIKNAIQEAVEAVEVIPLLDYAQQPDPPVIDQLWMDEEPAKSERVAVPDPAPWQENLYLVTVRVMDDYYPDRPTS